MMIVAFNSDEIMAAKKGEMRNGRRIVSTLKLKIKVKMLAL